VSIAATSWRAIGSKLPTTAAASCSGSAPTARACTGTWGVGGSRADGGPWAGKRR